MILLIAFAFLSGIVTVLSPCILPILPLLLSAGIGQGKYRPYGIIIGLIISFTFFTLTLTALVQATGISPDILRTISLGLIIFFGLTLLFPQLEIAFAKLTAPLARLGNRIESAGQTGTGFVSGCIMGTALGLIWAPCAGPILATVTTLVATGSVTLSTMLITFAYSCGTALPMFFIIYSGSKIVGSISAITPYTELIRKLFGILMILGAIAIACHFDVVLQQFAIRYFPTVSIDDTEGVKKQLELLRNEANVNDFSPDPAVGMRAPDFIGIVDWLNTPPLTMQELLGNVVLVDFWTYSCINCVRTLPYVTQWYEKYKDQGLIIVGVHTPEFEFEKNKNNVANAIKRFNITYPVALDNDYKTWNNYHNHTWPAHYLIDKNGIIQDIHLGEGEYANNENMIRSLLGLANLTQEEEQRHFGEQTPEIYLGFMRADNYTTELNIEPNKITQYGYQIPLASDTVGLKGTWAVQAESITSHSDSAILTLNFVGRHVYLVMSAEKPSLVAVLLDDQPVPAEFHSPDMNDRSEIMVTESRMYEMIDLKDTDGRHTLTLHVPENVSLYAFTFGS
jgi:cytochrome c biogenesis protein CcdA/thiol-disulfide isomerase/thioredoxin